jgi:hypothetical protein
MAMILDCAPLSGSSPHRNGIFQGALQLSTGAAAKRFSSTAQLVRMPALILRLV